MLWTLLEAGREGTRRVPKGRNSEPLARAQRTPASENASGQSQTLSEEGQSDGGISHPRKLSGGSGLPPSSESVCKESPVKPMKEKCYCGGVKKVIPYIIRGTNNLRGKCSVCEECDSYSHWPRAK